MKCPDAVDAQSKDIEIERAVDSHGEIRQPELKMFRKCVSAFSVPIM